MTIVIEGCDGTGKTTLAQEITKRGFTYAHTGKPAPGENVFETYTEQLVKARDRNVVFDRLHVGELVYGKIMRGRSNLSIEQMRLLNRLLLAQGGLFIFCLAPLESIIKNWKKRAHAEYVQDLEKLSAINRYYHRLFYDEFTTSSRSYDFTRWFDQVPAFVDTCLKRAPSCPDGVIGNPAGRYLFVGEQAGGRPDLAFYSDKRSSSFLNGCLWQAGYKEHELTFTNALTLGGKVRDLRSIYELDRTRTIIALGRVAQQTCARQGVPHLAAPHPQYIKRFKLRCRSNYVGLLRTFLRRA